MASAMDVGAGQITSKPHAHDVLCGRGGMTNSHAGNEWFRRLVRSNRPLYKSCPKHTKLLVAKAIVQAVQQQDPPGRFLEVANKEAGTWRQITYKRCVDKTSQALREKEPDILIVPGDDPEPTHDPVISEQAAKLAEAATKMGRDDADLSGLAKATLRQAGLDKDQPQTAVGEDRKRKANTMFVKPPWWGQTIPAISGYNNTQQLGTGGQGGALPFSPNKRTKTELDDDLPLPPDPLETRQSSLFRFLNGSVIFGRNGAKELPNANQMEIMRNRRSSGLFSFSGGARNSFTGQQQSMPNPSDLISMEAAAFEANSNMGNLSHPRLTLNQQQSLGMDLDPLPFNGYQQQQQVDHIDCSRGGLQQSRQNAFYGNNNLQKQSLDFGDDALEEMPTMGLMSNSTADEMAAPPPTNKLTTQVSDWLTSFWPTEKGQQIPQQRQQRQQQEFLPNPAPPAENLERSISSTIFNLARSPSQLMTSLKSGVTSMIFGTDDFTPIPVPQSTYGIAPAQGGSATLMGNASSSRRDSLLDDYEETPLETRLRSVTS